MRRVMLILGTLLALTTTTVAARPPTPDPRDLFNSPDCLKGSAIPEDPVLGPVISCLPEPVKPQCVMVYPGSELCEGDVVGFLRGVREGYVEPTLDGAVHG